MRQWGNKDIAGKVPEHIIITGATDREENLSYVDTVLALQVSNTYVSPKRELRNHTRSDQLA